MKIFRLFRYKSLKQQLAISIFLLITFILLIAISIFYDQGEAALRDQLRHRLIDVASTSSLLIPIEKHQKLSSKEDEVKPEYKQIKSILKNIKEKNTDIRFIYTMVKTNKNNIWEFVVDAEEDPKLVSHIGDEYDVSRFPEMQKGFNIATADKEIVKDEWGYSLSGYAPIKDKFGKSIGIIGLDLSANEVIDEELNLKITAFLILAFSTLVAWFLCKRVVENFYKPIENLINGIKRISENDFSHILEVEKDDEFGKLAVSFNNMVLKLRQYEEKMKQEVLTEKEEKKKIFKVYKDVMYAVSQGKFILLDQDEINEYIDREIIIGEQIIDKPEDVGLCRNLIGSILNRYSMDHKEIRKILLAISEGATNVIKHGKSGKLTIYIKDGFIKMILSDKGDGMPFDKIPYMVFFGGFSTKISLGFGFSLMYQFADKLLLNTTNTGTTIILEKKIA